MSYNDREDKKNFRVIDGKTFEFYKNYFDRKFAKLKGEELKISGDIAHYRVEKTSDGFILWIH